MLAETSDDTKYYAFALAFTAAARADLRAQILDWLEVSVRLETEERAACRDTDVRAATRVRPWELRSFSRSSTL